MPSSPGTTGNADDMPLFMRNAVAETPDLIIPPTERRPIPPELYQEMSQETIDLMAHQVKEEGDRLYREQRYEEAQHAYKCGCAIPTSDRNIRKLIILNMAATNLHLKDWFAVLRDTAWALHMDQKSVKALYRAAKASVELTRFEEALDCCDRQVALKLEPHNKPLQEEHRRALEGTITLTQQALDIAYMYNHLLIVPSIEDFVGTGPATKPSFLPFLDPPMPMNPTQATLFCYLSIGYAERSAGDMVAEFPFNQPILPVLDVLLPGSTPPTTLTSMREKLVFTPNPLSHSATPNLGFTHPTSWDPEYQFLPSTLAVYALTRNRSIIPITGQMTLSDVCVETKGLTEPFYDDNGEYSSGKDYIEIMQGLVALYAFRKGSEAEERFENADFESLSDLTEPGKCIRYDVTEAVATMTNMRFRAYNYGTPGRAVNKEGSPSFIARHRMTRLACGN